MDQITQLIASQLGITNGQLFAYLGILVAVANLIGRAIPDTAVGPLGILRKVCKVIGLYLGNRVAPGVSNNDAAQAVIGFRGLQNTIGAANEVKNAAATGADVGMKVNDVLNRLRHPSAEPGLPETTPGAPKQGSRVPDQYRTDGPFAAGAKAAAKKGK